MESKLEKGDKVKNVVMNGVKTGKVGKLENGRIDEEMRSQSEERLPRETQEVALGKPRFRVSTRSQTR